MPRHILYAYVDGADLDGVADLLDSRFAEFVNERQWTAGHASVVNQKHGNETLSQPGDLPLWDLGMNLELPDPDREPSGWFADIEAIAQFLGALHREFGRDFVIGIADTGTGITEDLFYVSTDKPDLAKLRLIVGQKGINSTDWPFDDPKNAAVFTVADIITKRAPILLVSHEEEDGSWQFLTAGDLPAPKDWKLVALSEIVAIDPTVKLLADLPAGYSASRASQSEAWLRWKSPVTQEEEI